MQDGVLQVGTLRLEQGSIFRQYYGTLTTSFIENRGQMVFTSTSTVHGDMVNYGEVSATNATVTFQNYTEHGIYVSDPSTTIILANLTVADTGYLVGASGDAWLIGNDFYNASTKYQDWKTGQAILRFVTGDDKKHILQIPGLDKHQSISGYASNFAWGTLDLTGQILMLQDGIGNDGGALYVGKIIGLTFDGMTVDDIIGSNGLNIYYDLGLNPELGGLTYSLTGGGYLEPVATPLPGNRMVAS